jgi:hypothetical protein
VIVRYSVLPSFVLGFHGCDKDVAENVLSGRAHLRFSRNKYDWLGSGIYFWENSPERALEWARSVQGHGTVQSPAVVGAVIDLGQCLNLLDRHYLQVVKVAYENLVAAARNAGTPLPRNRPLTGRRDLLLRDVDCAVVEMVHLKRDPPFDSIRAAFFEGAPLYKNSGFRDKNHIQICIRNLNCIKGYFRPLQDD